MQEQGEHLSITLKFGDWALPMTIRREEEFSYRQAEKLIKDRYNYYTNTYPNQKKEMYLVMTILDLAVKLKLNEAKDDVAPITSRLSPLLEELEAALESEK